MFASKSVLFGNMTLSSSSSSFKDFVEPFSIFSILLLAAAAEECLWLSTLPLRQDVVSTLCCVSVSSSRSSRRIIVTVYSVPLFPLSSTLPLPSMPTRSLVLLFLRSNPTFFSDLKGNEMPLCEPPISNSSLTTPLSAGYC